MSVCLCAYAHGTLRPVQACAGVPGALCAEVTGEVEVCVCVLCCATEHVPPGRLAVNTAQVFSLFPYAGLNPN